MLLVALGLRLTAPSLWTQPAVAAWTTVFAALCIQATPYLALGVVLSGALSVLVSDDTLRRALPRAPALAVPVAAVGAAALPGCECASVPLAAGLMRRGVSAAPAVAFLLAAPAVNPVVVVATATAFPGRPDIVLARVFASLGTAIVVGWLWLRIGVAPRLPESTAGDPRIGRVERLRTTIVHDLSQSLGLLVVGAGAAATVNAALPEAFLDTFAGHTAIAVVTSALLAVVLAVCSEADAFVAASFVRFPAAAQLAFMVVGPAVDLKLVAMQLGTFGSRMTLRLAPLTLVAAIGCAVAAGTWVA